MVVQEHVAQDVAGDHAARRRGEVLAGRHAAARGLHDRMGLDHERAGIGRSRSVAVGHRAATGNDRLRIGICSRAATIPAASTDDLHRIPARPHEHYDHGHDDRDDGEEHEKGHEQRAGMVSLHRPGRGHRQRHGRGRRLGDCRHGARRRLSVHLGDDAAEQGRALDVAALVEAGRRLQFSAGRADIAVDVLQQVGVQQVRAGAVGPLAQHLLHHAARAGVVARGERVLDLPGARQGKSGRAQDGQKDSEQEFSHSGLGRDAGDRPARLIGIVTSRRAGATRSRLRSRLRRTR